VSAAETFAPTRGTNYKWIANRMSPGALQTCCSICREVIAAERSRFRCSVSSCNAGRLKLVFCSPGCFEAHIPTARHKNASAIEVAGAADIGHDRGEIERP